LPSSQGKPWADNDVVAIWNLLAGLNSNDAYISGYKLLAQARRYHSPRRTEELFEEIYGHIRAGKIIILDLSLGDPLVRSRLVEQLASEVFHRSLEKFTNGEVPPATLLLVEACHNLLGRDMRLTDPWPRLAKEGGKLGIGLLLSTQEPSSIHRDILANTENWVVFHLNSEPERRVVQAYYDFASFEEVNAPEPGWARIKMASQTFVLPVQVDPFSLGEDDPLRPAPTTEVEHQMPVPACN